MHAEDRCGYRSIASANRFLDGSATMLTAHRRSPANILYGYAARCVASDASVID